MGEAEEFSVDELVRACEAANGDFGTLITDFSRSGLGTGNTNDSDSEHHIEDSQASCGSQEFAMDMEGGNYSTSLRKDMTLHQIDLNHTREIASKQLLCEANVIFPAADNDPEADGLSNPRKRRTSGKLTQKTEIQKIKRMRGEEYLGYAKSENENTKQRSLIQLREQRKMGPSCTSKYCAKTKLRSCSKFSDEVREQIFNEFWTSMDWGQKKACVRNLVDQTDKRHPRSRIYDSSRVNTFVYYLKLHGLKHQVCREMFLNTLGLKHTQVRNWLYKTEKPKSDRRPREQYQKSQKELDAVEFLNKLPKMPSHYCRASTNKMYLQSEFQNMTQLYTFYQSECKEANKSYFSRTRFVELVDEMNISIYRPKKDQCDICCSHEQGQIPEEDFIKHLEKKESARAEKRKDKDAAQSGSCHVIAVDVQAVFLSPKLNASALYYKTKLAVHNFSIYNLNSRDVKCYLWDESEGELVASVFATCLVDYIEENFTDGLPIIIYSDGCTNQNRNAVLSTALVDLASRKNITITQKYLEKGHTQMEVDSVHATIERRLKGKIINLPTDYVQICVDARKYPFPYKVKYMRYDDFKDYTKSQKLSSIRPGTKPGDPHVTDLRQLHYEASGIIKYKLEHTDDWTELPKQPRSIIRREFTRLYSKRQSITTRKYNDLQSLLSVLPKESHSFYQTLSHK